MKKGLIIAVAMVLAVCLGVGGTLAYLFVKTDTVTNTFSPSDITLNLTEDNVDNGSALENQYQMVPGKEIVKNPTVSADGNLPYYVFVEVSKKNDPDKYLTYSISDSWTKLTGVDGVDNVYYIAVNGGALPATSVLTDNKVLTNVNITKTDMAALDAASKYPQLIFTAYAIQQHGFANAAAAWPVAKAQQNP